MKMTLAWCLALALAAAKTSASDADLWALARAQTNIHRFSTLFTAHDVKNALSTEAGLERAVGWSKNTGLTKVYVESFRDGYQAEAAALKGAKEKFSSEGIEVSGCVTTTQVGKKSTGWTIIACYTDPPTQDRIRSIFEFTAGIFDEIMIDDFWFTDCACPECDAARKSKTVTIGEKKYPVAGDTWEDYRGELMRRISSDLVLGASRRVNPNARLIIKYPQWYDNFHERGYDVASETELFDRIWVGTETRDYNDSRWGGTVQYEAYFIMRWLGGIGGEKCGGGWYDWLGTTEKTYLEQARQTILGGARESLLFCYGGLQGSTGPKNVQALRENLSELFRVAKQVSDRKMIGVATYKPANSHGEKEKRIFDFVGMLGIPLAPCHEFPADVSAAFFSIHALKDSDFVSKFAKFLVSGKPALITDALAEKLTGKIELGANVQVLPVKGDPKSLLTLPEADAEKFRAPLLRALNVSFTAPNQVALYLFSDGSCVVENFNDEPAPIELNNKPAMIAPRGWLQDWKK